MKRFRGMAWPVLAVVLIAVSAPALAGGDVYTSWGKAINGYDPVAYFTEGKPVEGKGAFSTDWMGATGGFPAPPTGTPSSRTRPGMRPSTADTAPGR